MKNKTEKLILFLEETIDYFVSKVEGVSRDKYFADRDVRNILDKTINDIVLCVVDISEEILLLKGRAISETYRDTVLSCYEFMGDIVLKVAPLTKHRNETIHQYLKINWQNIITVKQRVSHIKQFVEKARFIFVTDYK